MAEVVFGAIGLGLSIGRATMELLEYFQTRGQQPANFAGLDDSDVIVEATADEVEPNMPVYRDISALLTSAGASQSTASVSSASIALRNYQDAASGSLFLPAGTTGSHPYCVVTVRGMHYKPDTQSGKRANPARVVRDFSFVSHTGCSHAETAGLLQELKEDIESLKEDCPDVWKRLYVEISGTSIPFKQSAVTFAVLRAAAVIGNILDGGNDSTLMNVIISSASAERECQNITEPTLAVKALCENNNWLSCGSEDVDRRNMPVILIAGRSGSGKSSFGNHLLETGRSEGSFMTVKGTTGTTTVRGFVVERPHNENAVVVDCPGLGDTSGMEALLSIEISEKLKHVRKAATLVLMTRLDANGRMGPYQEDLKQLRLYETIYGHSIYKNLVVVMASEYPLEPAEIGPYKREWAKILTSFLQSNRLPTADIKNRVHYVSLESVREDSNSSSGCTENLLSNQIFKLARESQGHFHYMERDAARAAKLCRNSISSKTLLEERFYRDADVAFGQFKDSISELLRLPVDVKASWAIDNGSYQLRLKATTRGNGTSWTNYRSKRTKSHEIWVSGRFRKNADTICMSKLAGSMSSVAWLGLQAYLTTNKLHIQRIDDPKCRGTRKHDLSKHYFAIVNLADVGDVHLNRVVEEVENCCAEIEIGASKPVIDYISAIRRKP